ncbi:unnamed protein product [Caenorhabditis nigoni]
MRRQVSLGDCQKKRTIEFWKKVFQNSEEEEGPPTEMVSRFEQKEEEEEEVNQEPLHYACWQVKKGGGEKEVVNDSVSTKWTLVGRTTKDLKKSGEEDEIRYDCGIAY